MLMKVYGMEGFDEYKSPKYTPAPVPEFQNDKFVVIPETDGTKIDTDTFREKVITAVDGLNAELDLSKEGCY